MIVSFNDSYKNGNGTRYYAFNDRDDNNKVTKIIPVIILIIIDIYI